MKRHFKWAMMILTLPLTACVVTYWLAMWDVQFPVRNSPSSQAQSALHERADGAVLLAYRPDDDTIAVDTYDREGTLQQQQRFGYSSPAHAQALAPLFLADDQLVWFGRGDRDSVVIDLTEQTVTHLQDVLGLDKPLDVQFEIAESVVLANGQWVMAGGDRRTPTSPFRQGRVVVMDPDGTVQTGVLELPVSFTNLVARDGSDQYYVQYFEFDPSIPATTAITFMGEGVLLTEQTSLREGSLVQADLNGAWATPFFTAGLLHYDVDHILDSVDYSVLVRKLVSTSDGHYLMLQLVDDEMSLVKRNAQGAILWQREATEGATLNSSFTEQDGYVWYSESFSSRVQGVQTLEDDAEQPVLNVAEKVRHLLLNSKGRIVARFREPDHKSVLPQDPESGETGTALEYTAGSCQHFGAQFLTNGQVAAVSRWCGDNAAHNRRESLFLFRNR